MSSVVFYIITEGTQDYLCVIDDTKAYDRGHFRFPIDARALARLQVEGAERIFRAVKADYATRSNAPPLTST